LRNVEGHAVLGEIPPCLLWIPIKAHSNLTLTEVYVQNRYRSRTASVVTGASGRPYGVRDSPRAQVPISKNRLMATLTCAQR
jgi:hypothetical protein